jgi:hypothetical protein
MDPISRIGLATIQSGSSRAAQDSAQVVRAFSPDAAEDPVEALINLRQDATQVRAGVAIVQTATDLTRYILDIVA